MVMEFSTLGRRMHGARFSARALTYVSSAEVSSMSLVKCVMSASRVAMLTSLSWIRVFVRTETLAAGSTESAVVV
jgi:hypothetical protein